MTALAYSLPAAWILASPPFSPAINAAQKTRDHLAADLKVLKAATDAAKTLPIDLAEIRAFARSRKMDFSSRDGYGAPYSYLRLSDSHYVFRSFGGDGRPATLLETQDPALARLGTWPKNRALQYRYAKRPDLDVYPAVMLMGAGSPNGVWRARLYPDEASGTRHLVVKDKRKRDHFMVAPHDSIEEFLWLPDGHRIVYSATMSVRYRDGLYLWDLTTDHTVNLVDTVTKGGPISPAARAEPLWISLAGVQVDGPTIYAYFALRNDGPLNPVRFFARSQLAAFVVPDKKEPRFVKAPPLPSTDDPPFTRPLNLSRHVERAGKDDGLKVQRRWLALGFRGDLEKVLTDWQAFSEKEADSPLFPYCLWYLSSLYSESFTVMARGAGAQTADVLRTYGTEIARALLSYRLAPSYLRGLAMYTYQNLMSGRPLPYRFARLKTGAVVPPSGTPRRGPSPKEIP